MGWRKKCFIIFGITSIIGWFVDNPVVVRDDSLIEEEEVDPEKISNAIVDDNVDVYLVRKYFTSDAWLVVEDVIKCKSKTLVWTCQSVPVRFIHATVDNIWLMFDLVPF